MSNYEWKSPLAPYMQEHIAIQQAAGFKFEDQIKVLQFFDRYLFYNGYQETLLEKGMTDGFIYIKVSDLTVGVGKNSSYTNLEFS